MNLHITNTKYLILILLLSLVYSCNDNKAELPAYLLVDSIELATTVDEQGSNSQNITDIWVYINDQPIGVFDTKKLIPIIADDYSNVNIKLFAGIRSNGLKNNIDIYFLYKEIELNKSLIQGEVDTIKAVFNYDNFTEFVFKEGFENGNIFNKDNDGDYTTKIDVTSSNAIYGKKCGLISLDSINNNINVTTSEDYYNLPKDGNRVYLELDYTCNTEFVIGISGKDKNSNEYSTDIIILKKNNDWNKLYLNLTQTIIDSNLESYKIYIRVIHPTNINSTKVYLDNLKLVYLNR